MKSAKRDVTQRRPNPQAGWVCGYQHLGLACNEGPSSTGRCCQVDHGSAAKPASDADPVSAVEGDRASCDQDCACAAQCELAQLRKQPQLPSHARLGPCIPRRAGWFTRQSLTLNAAILVAGLLLLSMVLPQREAIFVPGGLSRKHAQILENRLVSQRCSLCHPNSHADVSVSVLQDDLCMQCHQGHLPDAGRRSPHDLSPHELQALSQGSQELLRLVSIPLDSHARAASDTDARAESANQAALGDTSCAQCHIEHHGAEFDLTAINDGSCHACHRQKFASFSSGHPEFDGFPYRTTRRLAFDHAAHAQKYFATKNEKFDCSRCHLDTNRQGQVGSVFRSASFERACASCHENSIAAETVTGWAVLQLPSLDARDVEDSAHGLSDWPAAARFGYEGELSAPARLLLAADPAAAEALRRLPASGKLQDIRLHLPARAEVTRELARGLKRLIAEVGNEGQVAWQRRLATTAEHALQRELTEQERELVRRVSAGLAPDLFRQMQKQWFSQQPPYVATGRMPSGATAPAIAAHLASQVAGPNGDLLLAGEDTLLENAQLFDEAEADDLLNGAVFDGPQSAVESLGSSLPADGAPHYWGQFTRLQGSQHVAAGGWYLDSQLLSLVYMPRGHGDATLAAWAEYLALLDSSSAAPKAGGHAEHKLGEGRSDRADLISHLRTLGNDVPGSCAECHLLSGAESLPADSVWESQTLSAAARPFTKFDHTPHLTLPALSDCGYCHQLSAGDSRHSLGQIWQELKDDEPYADAARGCEVAHAFFDQEFTTMRLDQCTACHRPGGANDGCTQCHNYHVGSQGLRQSNRIRVSPPRSK